ncbi:MAG TPA: UDP-4-amino-4,6-dideoxy-N-acetyl-beta-L-altrosamine transaminase [Nitrospiraceae bacterium]|jgi:dTDP-4-amino-4,6-dideoxygalactose transaminase|nr:UDP-4-amino-4,6-dideoxy-N-acetyl-beta-L-altrosamine transaminase [Nitrospiraceae bacterium]
MRKIEFFHHSIDDKDRERVTSVLKSIFLTTGKEVEEFEQKFSRYIGLRHTVGLTSCTAALHLSLIALGIGQGDEVITTPMSFCATANAVLHAGAKPIFVDVEEETGNVNASLIESAITERTRAIIPVHLYGQMCDMRTIHEIAQRYNLRIIEDAAHAIEASRDAVKVGQLSNSVCFSFYATKNITSGEGGALSANDESFAASIRMLRLHGINRDAADRYTGRYRHWDMSLLGWKYNMDNVQGALLIGQLERIEDLWKRRDMLWKTYEEELQSIKDVKPLKTVAHARHARHLFTILVPHRRRDALLWALQDRGIGVAVNYRPIHLLSYYRETFGYNEGAFPVAEEIGKSTISLPLYPSLEQKDIQYISKVLKEELSK